MNNAHSRISRRQWLQTSGALVGASAWSGLGLSQAWAQGAGLGLGNWPQKVIRIVVPNPAGGTADVLPRLILEQLGSRLGQSVIVDNKPGAAGNIGAEFVANAEPDGYTLLASPPTTLAINPSLYPKLNYDASKFVPITILATVPNVLMVHPSVPFNTVQEFMAYAKVNPDKLTYASQGSGSTAHLTAELFKMRTGLKLVHIPYKGDAPAMADLLAGHVNLMFGNIAAANVHLKAGKLKILAVTSPKRLAALPEVPALNDFVPGMVSVTWFGLVAPAKTPPAIAAKLSATISDILKMPEIAKRFAEASADPLGNTPEEAVAWIKEESERWRAVVRAGNIKVD